MATVNCAESFAGDSDASVEVLTSDVLRALPLATCSGDDPVAGIDFTERSLYEYRYSSSIVERLFLTLEMKKSARGYMTFLAWYSVASLLTALTTSDTQQRLIGIVVALANVMGIVADFVVTARFASSRAHLRQSAREICSALTLFTTNVCLGYGFMYFQRVCVYVFTFDNRSNHERCPFRLYPFWFWAALTLHLAGRPRAFLVAIIAVPSVIFPFVLRFWREGPTASVWLAFVTSIVFTALVVALKYIDERQQRRQFEARLTLQAHSEELRMHTAALAAFVKHITPIFLRDRLSAHAGVLADVSDAAVCAVVDVHDSARFMTTLLPLQSAVAIGRLASQCAELARQHEVHVIRTIGDVSTTVSGLFDLHDLHGDVLSTAVPRMSRFGLAVRDQSELQTRCGVAVGSLMGMPVGVRCIRYDIAGVALVRAREIIQECQPNTVRIDRRAVAHLGAAFLAGIEREADSEGSSCGGNSSHASVEVSVSSNTSGDGPDCCSLKVSAAAAVQEEGLAPSFNKVRKEESFAVADNVATSAPYFARSARSEDETEEAAGAAWPIHSRITTAVLEQPAPAQVLELSGAHTRCICFQRFASPATELAFALHNFRQHHRSFAACMAFHATFAGMLMFVVLVDGHATADDASVMGMALLGACSIANAVLAWRLWVTETHSIRAVVLGFVLALLILVGVNLTRPSIIGDDAAYLLFLLLASCILWGAPLNVTIGMQGILLASFYLLGLFRPIFTLGTFMLSPAATLIAMDCAHSRQQQSRLAFSASVRSVEVLRELTIEQRLRNAVLEALVPRRLKGMLTRDSILVPHLESWAADDTVTVQLLVAPSAMAEWMSSPAQYRVRIDALLESVRAAVLRTTHGTLELVNVFGSSFLVAGPLVERGMKSQVEGAASDAFELLDFALLHASVPLTCAAAVEQVVYLLRLSAFPQFDLCGPSVSISRALVDAAPAPMTVVTERMANVYQQQCNPPPRSVQVAVQSRGEQWRIRGVGSVKVHRVVADIHPPS